MDAKLKNLAVIILLGVFIIGLASATSHQNTSCPFTAQSDRTIIKFDDFIRSDKTLSDATTFKETVSLAAGSYDVSLYAFDGPKTRGTQPDESYKLIFLDSSGNTVAESGATSDLEDNVDFAEVNELVSVDLNIPSGVVKVAGLHAVYPDSSANSLIAGCAALDFNQDKKDRNKKSNKEEIVFICDPNWECSGWGDCFDGVMTRTCHDTNSCNVVYNKPVEKADCELPKALVKEGVNFLPVLITILLIILVTVLAVVGLRR